MGKGFDDATKTFAGIGAMISTVMSGVKLGGMIVDAMDYYKCPNCGKRYSGSLQGKSIKCSCGEKFFAK